jgi:uroporphyrinogen decarboxylase
VIDGKTARILRKGPAKPVTMDTTARERMIAAMTNQQADRVPVAPDISNMIPCRLTGKPFWEIYYFADPPLWRAYIDAVKYFGFDGWFTEGAMQYQWPGDRYTAIEDIHKTAERWVVRTRGRIDGETYHEETTYYVGDPPTLTVKPISDLTWSLLEKWFEPPVGYNPSLLHEQRQALGELGAFGVGIGYPGFQAWFGLFRGSVMDLSEWYYFQHDDIERLRQLHERQVLKQMDMILNERPDFVLLGGSGTVTLQSPKIARELSFPTIQKLTRMAREAGVPTMLHSCGKERELIRWCAEESDLDCINPLEVAPMGDCDLAEVKRAHGHQIALMGNLHTTDVMLRGTPQDVERAACAAIDAAGAGGGFILSTGDQCGRDTPDENIFKLIEVAKTYGRYN